MTGFVEILLSYPTVLFTVASLISLLYWILVILGAVDVDGLLHGAGEGAGEAAGGAVDSLHPGGAHHAGEAAGLLSALGMRGVPITVIVSLSLLISWVSCGMAMELLGQLLPASFWVGPWRWILGTGVAATALAVGVLVAAAVLRPFRHVVRTEQGRSRSSLVGLTGLVTTSRVDQGFGQAEVQVDGDSILVDVRCEQENELGRGSLVLLFEHDLEADLFLVVPHRED